MTKQIITIPARRRKSDVLSKEEAKGLGAFVKGHLTIVDAAEAIGIHRAVLDKVLTKGQASPESIKKIRAAISAKV